MLFRRQAEPGGPGFPKGVAATLERGHGRAERLHGGSADGTDPGDGHETGDLLVLRRPPPDVLLERIDFLAQVGDLSEQEPGELAHRRRQRDCLISEGLDQTIDPCPTPILRMLGGATTPNSARCPIRALIDCGRWRTRRSRVRNSMPWPCCSAALTATNRPLGNAGRAQCGLGDGSAWGCGVPTAPLDASVMSFF